ncbi:MAG: hypothetical protein DMD80_01005 [Candidatus Rokuibacteriota bacterium]|nr:MAG: hypothetical protein DMD80_01005 [Candidatus Rokubacteria bacterium]PYQ00467.1 MAG: hypothetical protein DMF83_28010 [Acidobacteriota bacterium]
MGAERARQHAASAHGARDRAHAGYGYTTVRDAGGLDAGFRAAIDEGLITGPLADVRVLQTPDAIRLVVKEGAIAVRRSTSVP